MKFGGTSVGSAGSIRNVIGAVKASLGRNPFVVVSAVSGITDLLIAAAQRALDRKSSVRAIVKEVEEKHRPIIEALGLDAGLISDELAELEHVLFGISLIRELTARTTDYVVSFGERMSSKIVAAYAGKSGINAQAFNAYDLGMVTDGNFGNAEILQTTYGAIAAAVKGIPAGVIPIVTGFIGKTSKGEVTTLGRGGSDYTAAIYGVALNSEEIQIWTDVDGVMTADPKLVPGASTVPVVSFEEASELAYFGAKVLHPKTIVPAMNREIPVRVLNTFNPSGKGTLILKTVGKNERSDVTAITCKKNIYVININSARMLLAFGFLHHVFKLFDEFNVPVDLIATSEVNVSVTVERKFEISELVARLKEFADVTVLSDRASISIVGRGIRSTPGIGGRIFSTLGKNGINIEMTSQSYSVVNESIVIREERLDEAVQALHGEFFGAAAVGVDKGAPLIAAAAATVVPIAATQFRHKRNVQSC
ncbi:aspartate kinase [Candidatus Woesearchaeota archaeon]|nr:aspartate kinase [Candidatus Woesearchaeota archaeon]